MTDESSVAKLRQIIQQQLIQSRELRADLAALRAQETHRQSPLAVVGLGLRFPGGIRTPEDYWTFLIGDDDVRSEIPLNRPGLRDVFDPRTDHPGTSYVNTGAFIDEVAEFDAGFFGVSAREAASLDPQQRLLLETSYEALERAGIPADRTARLNAGVFVGIMASEYGERIAQDPDKKVVDPYYGTGGGHCFAAGRISYALGLSGPALSIDTACSSSLVALHLAAQSLRAGECRYAIVGGSNLMFSPELMISLAQSQALSPSGRSKTFRADADGYGRAEGVGTLVLMRLEEAERNGHPVLAVLRGSAVNHDGASSGLTVPNGPAQQELIRQALTDASIAPEDVGWLEAHGTGTALGDPIELGALTVLAGREVPHRRTPLGVGSVKSRLGHMEAAAGIAGLLKVVLMLQHGIQPAAVEPDATLNPLAPWATLNVDVPTAPTPWPADYPERIAGISAFGLSGTNAHALLSAAPLRPDEPHPASTVERHLLTLSAKDAAAVTELAEKVGAFLQRHPGDVAALCHTLNSGRVAQGTRLAVTGADADELRTALARAVVELQLSPGARRDAASLVLGIGDGVSDADLAALGLRSGQKLPEFLADLGLPPTLETVVGSAVEVRLGTASWSLTPGTRSQLLDVLADAFTRGARLRLHGLAPVGTRLLASAPTYPFRRTRHWIDEPVRSGRAPEELTSAATGQAPAAYQPVAIDELRAQNETGDGSQDAAGRAAVHAFLLDELAGVLREDGDIDADLSFLEVGGDSFTAMLLAKSFEQYYCVEMPVEEFAIEVPLHAMSAQLHAYLYRVGALNRALEPQPIP